MSGLKECMLCVQTSLYIDAWQIMGAGAGLLKRTHPSSYRDTEWKVNVNGTSLPPSLAAALEAAQADWAWHERALLERIAPKIEV